MFLLEMGTNNFCLFLLLMICSISSPSGELLILYNLLSECSCMNFFNFILKPIGISFHSSISSYFLSNSLDTPDISLNSIIFYAYCSMFKLTSNLSNLSRSEHIKVFDKLLVDPIRNLFTCSSLLVDLFKLVQAVPVLFLLWVFSKSWAWSLSLFLRVFLIASSALSAYSLFCCIWNYLLFYCFVLLWVVILFDLFPSLVLNLSQLLNSLTL